MNQNQSLCLNFVFMLKSWGIRFLMTHLTSSGCSAHLQMKNSRKAILSGWPKFSLPRSLRLYRTILHWNYATLQQQSPLSSTRFAYYEHSHGISLPFWCVIFKLQIHRYQKEGGMWPTTQQCLWSISSRVHLFNDHIRWWSAPNHCALSLILRPF